jgi:uncharacterized protein involved in exopolysaccharide biosynthesis
LEREKMVSEVEQLRARNQEVYARVEELNGRLGEKEEEIVRGRAEVQMLENRVRQIESSQLGSATEVNSLKASLQAKS